MSNATAAKLIAYGEEERRRVARELHDDIGQRLALLADDAERLRRDVQWEDEGKIRRLANLAEQARALGEDLRRISHALHPSILDDLGIAAALRSLTKDFAEQTGLPVVFEEKNITAAFSKEVSASLYRIVQEALQNIKKHAGETPVRVGLKAEADVVVLAIVDFGRGFNPSERTGLGMVSMKERAALAGGTFKLKSETGKGTTIEVRLPVEPSAAR